MHALPRAEFVCTSIEAVVTRSRLISALYLLGNRSRPRRFDETLDGSRRYNYALICGAPLNVS